MKRGMKIILMLILVSFLVACCPDDKETQSLAEIIAEKDLEKEFTLEEKIGQLIITIPPLKSDSVELEELFDEYHVGGLIYMNWINDIKGMSKAEILEYTKMMQQKSAYPLFISADIEGGEINRIKSFHPLKTSQEYGTEFEEAEDQEVVKEAYRKDISELAEVLGEVGINLNFAPVLDVERTLDDGVFSQYGRAYSTNTETVTTLGEIYTEALQENGILATIKHFPGHGHTTCDTFLGNCGVDLTLEEYRERDLPPFVASLTKDPKFTMVGLFSSPYDPEKISIHSSIVIQDLLRGELGFEGIVITDDYMMGAVKDLPRDELTLDALNAGADIFLTTNAEDVPLIYDSLLTAVNTGVVSEERIEESFQRVVELKKEYFG
jgi:beta-N-acetylhexosaminidase